MIDHGRIVFQGPIGEDSALLPAASASLGGVVVKVARRHPSKQVRQARA
jgi:hypothetical protein